MNDDRSFWAFIATLCALVLIYCIGAVLAFLGKPLEALGLSGAGTGLIGLLGTFRPKQDKEPGE